MQPIDTATLAQLVMVSTRDVFATMLGMEVTAGDPYVEHEPPNPTEGVVALIGLTGQWVGTGSLFCSASFACQISALMLMTEFESVCEDVLDAVAEVINMIIGNVKTGLEEQLGPMGLSIPTVFYGKNFTARCAGEGEWTVFPFLNGEDRLDVKIHLAPDRRPVVRARAEFSDPCTHRG
jgi:chemotaxis protein CheX